jgi:hypothetical protein
MTPAELTSIGRGLFGPLWKSKLARALGRDYTTVNRWTKGDNEIPETAIRRIRELEQQGSKS